MPDDTVLYSHARRNNQEERRKADRLYCCTSKQLVLLAQVKGQFSRTTVGAYFLAVRSVSCDGSELETIAASPKHATPPPSLLPISQRI